MQIIEYISNWLNDYLSKSKLKGFVVGISGGVDSALTASLCAKTGHKVLLLNMP
ncbi:MAG: NAD(+) synthase, partial [Crocinitomicaceae bacterium]